MTKLYPDVDAKTLSFLFTVESGGWKAPPLTAKDMARQIALVKGMGGPELANMDSLDPASLIFP